MEKTKIAPYDQLINGILLRSSLNFRNSIQAAVTMQKK